MERLTTDTDASSQSTVGVGQVDPTPQPLYAIRPNWLSDGYGIRGPQRPISTPVQQPAQPMSFGLPNGKRSEQTSNGLIVTDGTTTVTSVSTISFDGTVFTVTDNGNGEAHIACAT